MLNVVMPSVVMLSVLAPAKCYLKNGLFVLLKTTNIFWSFCKKKPKQQKKTGNCVNKITIKTPVQFKKMSDMIEQVTWIKSILLLTI
jgi:hypothetical protein